MAWVVCGSAHSATASCSSADAASTPVLSSIAQHPRCRCKHLKLQLVFCVTTYVLVHALCVIIFKFLNYRYNFVYPIFMAMVCESTWMVSFPILFFLSRRYSMPLKRPCRRRLCIYILIGAGFSVSKTLASYSETLLPGSIFSIISSSDIVFYLTFSRIILKRKVTRWHMVSMMLLIAGVLPNVVEKVFVANHHQDATDRAKEVTGISLSLALGIAFIGIAEEALSAVVSDWLLKHNLFGEGNAHRDVERLSEAAWQANLIFIVEYSSYLSLFAFLGMFVPLAIFGEYKLWPAAFRGMSTGEASILHPGTDAIVGITLSLLATVLSRMYMRFGQYYMMSVRSAFTFAVVKPAPRLLQIIVLCVVFGEVLTWTKVIGMLLTTAGFLVYAQRTRDERIWSQCTCSKAEPAEWDGCENTETGLLANANSV